VKHCRKKLHTYPKDKRNCPHCAKIANKAWFDKRPDYGLNYFRANRDKINERTNRWKKENRCPIAHKEAVLLWQRRNPDIANARSMRRVASKLRRTPKWLTKEDHGSIREFYTSAKELEKIFGIKYHVDHIIPLRGANVSGLHVPWNLQILTAKENTKKGNKLQKELL
jgi:5-methylcytosine-specific restriction endonuclease McrA